MNKMEFFYAVGIILTLIAIQISWCVEKVTTKTLVYWCFVCLFGLICLGIYRLGQI